MDNSTERPKYPSQPPPPVNSTSLHVMISGAGLGGMLLAILLEKAGIPYQIYERASNIKRLGAVLALNFNILPALEQIGLLEELKSISVPGGAFNVFSGGEMKFLKNFEFDTQAIGYDLQVFSRPLFYDMLLAKIPKEKIHLGKKVLSMEQSKQGVMIRCSDGTTYHGDILVGADGAYSGVRQGLYKLMSDDEVLPEVDGEELAKGYITMVGTTRPMSPEKIPALSAPKAEMNMIIGDGTQYSWSTFIVANNCICWNITRQFASIEEATNFKFMNSEWGPEGNEKTINEVRDFKTPYGTLGDLIEATPKDLISRVFLEDKLFETWHYNRTVLIGDACHKLLPAAGQGAVNALQDAVILANCLYECPSRKQEDIQAALQAYRDDRYPHVKLQYERSKSQAKIQYGQTFFERCLRHVIFNYVPAFIRNKAIYKTAEYRPLVSFLPPPPKRGTLPVLPQKPSKRYAEEQAKLAEQRASKPMPALPL